MSTDTGIEWTDATWNPFIGCSIITPGCTNCYAMQLAHRLKKMGSDKYQKPLTREVNGKPVWTGNVYLDEGSLSLPLRWRKPRRIFVNSMSDLFHENAHDEDIDRVFAAMALAPQHTFQVLTKRAERMRRYLTEIPLSRLQTAMRTVPAALGAPFIPATWPLPNVWLGVSVEDQRRANDRIPHLLNTPAAKHFISAEPLLGPLKFEHWFPRHDPDGLPWLYGAARLDWIIVGGESGPGARRTWVPFVRSVVRQGLAGRAKVYVKQLGAVVTDRKDAGIEGRDPGEWPDMDPARIEENLDGTLNNSQGAPVRVHLRDRKGGDPAEWPEALRVREFP